MDSDYERGFQVAVIEAAEFLTSLQILLDALRIELRVERKGERQPLLRCSQVLHFVPQMLEAGVITVRVHKFAPSQVAFRQPFGVLKLQFRSNRKQCCQISNGEVEPRRRSRDVEDGMPATPRVH